jgi:hypothetical protein
MAKYIAVEAITHNGKVYAPGKAVPLSDEQARQLLDIGHVKAEDEAAEPKADAKAEPKAKK